jgi:Chaperone of endosialidase
MARIKHQGLVAKCVRFSVAATVAALIGAGRVMPAAAQTPCSVSSGTNTFCGTNAGAGAIGPDDSAFGFDALSSGDVGFGVNTAIGAYAMYRNTMGYDNTATGAGALQDNTTGNGNVAVGNDASIANTTGGSNTAIGGGAMGLNTTGSNNTAIGLLALYANGTGSGNIAIGGNAGQNLTTGDNNIDISHPGLPGESNTIRIGTKGTQTEAFVQGIYDSALTALSPRPVVVNSNGRLGYMPSAARYKRDIRDMGDTSSGLMKLRPVSFRYKEDPAGRLQYGLIAEEVQRVYPELVTRGDDGKLDGVRYELLPALLINEAQRQAKESKQKDAQIAALQRQIVSQQHQITALQKKDAQIDAVAERMNALERQVRLARPDHLASAMR